MQHPQSSRYWEIDSLRGIAIILMIAYHFIFDFSFFGGWAVNMSSLPFVILQKIIATTFILLVGVSLTISYSRKRKILDEKGLFFKYFWRGLEIFGYGLIITLVTFFFLRDGFVRFGILHFIGMSIILAFLLVRFFPRYVLYPFIGAAAIIAGIFLNNLTVSYPWLLWLGITPEYFYTVDYFPLLPWFGIVLLGLFFGNLLYPSGKRNFRIADFSNYRAIRAFSFLGRHSLIIYLAHQPVLVLFLHLFVL
jgi:uncharacterized membrane protein